MFGEFNIDCMNETDVREIIVRPFLERLGYRQGSEANIRTEVPLKYTQLQLGRKKPKTDPPMQDLRGKPDYFLDAIPYGRWAADAKAPDEPVTGEASMQCHTYCTHPEVGGTHYMLINGREFAIYRVGKPDAPILHWKIADTEANFDAVKNLLGPAAIKQQSQREIDFDTPIIEGFGSKIMIAGGTVYYDKFESNRPVSDEHRRLTENIESEIVSGGVIRTKDGRIGATFSIDQSKLAGGSFQPTPDNVMSMNFHASGVQSLKSDTPTTFQNIISDTVVDLDRFKQSELPSFLKQHLTLLPMPYRATAYTEAMGVVVDRTFSGKFYISYGLELLNGNPLLAANGIQARHFVNSLNGLELKHFGRFEVEFVPAG